MKGSYHTPLLKVGETGYQYGANGTNYAENLVFHVGDPTAYNMTPARLYGADGNLKNYLQGVYNMSTHSTIGVYFDNKDVMYIDGISIPVKNSVSEATKTTLFPEGSYITVNIYEASGIDARTDNRDKRSESPKKSIILNSGNYQEYSAQQTQRGALSTTFEPLSISGSFVVEIINTGCVFTVYSSTEKENKWGYYIDNEEEKYPATYTPLISVHAMFPVLYGEANESLEVTVPSTGSTFGDADCPTRTVYANCKYETNKNGWSRKASQTGVITMSFKTAEQNDDYTKWYFVMDENKAVEERKVDVTFNFRGKELTYHVTQAPKLQSISLSEEAISLKVSDEYNNLTATLSPATTDQTEITWSSSNGNVATVNENGIVTAVALGTAIIKATSKADNNIYAECTVTVTPKVEALIVPTSNLIAPSAGGAVKFTNDQIDYTQIEYTITGKNFVKEDWDVSFNTDCDWLEYELAQGSVNHAIITLKANKENKTDGKRSATVTIKAYSATSTFSYPITQAPMIKGITLMPPVTKLAIGNSTKLNLDFQPFGTDQTEITWSSSDDKIATVDADGNVTAVASGIDTIIAKSVANLAFTDTCIVTVCGIVPVDDPSKTTLTALAEGSEIPVSFTLWGEEFNTTSWQVFSNEKPTWITVAPFTSASNTDGSITVTCTLTADKNATGLKRDGTVTITAFSTNKFTYSISQESSAFYKLPEGAFGSGMTENGGLLSPYIVAPYIHGESYEWKSTTGEGKWTVDSKTVEESSETYTMPVSMKEKYNIPVFEQEGNKKFQFGIKENEGVRTDSYFYVGDSTMRYITPALLFTDLASNLKGQSIFYLPLQNVNVTGVYFNNKDVMYIDRISIPIYATGSSLDEAQKKEITDMLPTNSHVKVAIYHATINGDEKSFVKTNENLIWDSTLTNKAFTPNADNKLYCGALKATFNPIPIEGPFVIELSDMSGCAFRIFASKERSDCNKWGYCLDANDNEINQGYTPAISVHAMFPALYPKAYTDTVIYIPAEGVGGSSGNERPQRTVFANYKWTKDKNGWKRTETTGITMNFETATQSADSTVWMFTMGANTTTAERHAYVTFTFRGKELKYHLIQVPAPYTRTVTAGNWGTICLPYAAKSFTGAEMYSIAGKMEGETGIYLDQVEKMEAGKPYIFKATAEKIEVVYAAGEPQKADTVNGLYGYIGESDFTVPEGYYIVYDNALYLVNSDVKIASNRAYIHYADVPGTTPSPAPQVRRVAMPINGAPANMLQVSDTKQPVKILRDGHIVILRADKEYDILGQSK